MKESFQFLQKKRIILDEAHQLVHKGLLIPAHKSYIHQRNAYDKQCQKVGLNKMHCLRHAYAQTRYETLTGWRSPKVGELLRRELPPEKQIKDEFARQTISRELDMRELRLLGFIWGGEFLNH